MKLPSRWRSSKKSAIPTGTSPEGVGYQTHRFSPIKDEHVRRALENVRNLSATSGKEFGLTILDRNAEYIGWMNFACCKMPSTASSEHRKAMVDGFEDCQSPEAA